MFICGLSFLLVGGRTPSQILRALVQPPMNTDRWDQRSGRYKIIVVLVLSETVLVLDPNIRQAVDLRDADVRIEAVLSTSTSTSLRPKYEHAFDFGRGRAPPQGRVVVDAKQFGIHHALGQRT